MSIINKIPAVNRSPLFYDSYLLKDLFNHGAAEKKASQLPAVNVSFNDETYLLELVAPGLKKEHFTLSFEKDMLTVAYQDEPKQAENKPKYLLKEYNGTSFSRSFTFPKGVVDEAKIAAQYIDGILYLELPKMEAAKPKPARQIAIS